MKFKLQKGPRSTHRQSPHTIFWAQNPQSFLSTHLKASPFPEQKSLVPYSKDQNTMDYAPLQISLILCLFSSPPSWEGRRSYPSPTLHFQLEHTNTWWAAENFVPLLHTASCLHLPFGDSHGHPVLLPPAPFDWGRVAAAASSQLLHSKQLGPSLALCRGLLLCDTPVSSPITKQPALGMASDFHQTRL